MCSTVKAIFKIYKKYQISVEFILFWNKKTVAEALSWYVFIQVWTNIETMYVRFCTQAAV